MQCPRNVMCACTNVVGKMALCKACCNLGQVHVFFSLSCIEDLKCLQMVRLLLNRCQTRIIAMAYIMIGKLAPTQWQRRKRRQKVDGPICHLLVSFFLFFFYC
jgi:hypothetical protein